MKYLFYLPLCWLLFSCGGINKITYQRTGTSIVEAYNDEAHLTNEYQKPIKLISQKINEECDSIFTKRGTIIVAQIIEKTKRTLWYKSCPENTDIKNAIRLKKVTEIIPSLIDHEKEVWEVKLEKQVEEIRRKKRRKAVVTILILASLLTGGLIWLFAWLFGLAS